MMIGENLQILRKGKGLTQEELAEKLGVSRQAVSKWETGEAYPETETFLKLCELYGVTADELLRGNVSGIANGEPKKKVKEEADRFSLFIAFGVLLTLIGAAACTLLCGIGEYYADSRFAVIGAACVILFVAVAVFFFVYGGITHENFRKENTEEGASEEVKAKFTKKFPLYMALCVSGMLVFTVFLILALTLFVEEGTPKGALVSCCVTAAYLFGLGFCIGGIVLTGIRHAQYLGLEPAAGKKDRRSRILGAVNGAIMMSATIIFLLCGFLGNLWHIAWIAFPVGGILCGIVSAVSEAFKKDE